MCTEEQYAASHGGVPLAKGTETSSVTCCGSVDPLATEVSPSRRGLKQFSVSFAVNGPKCHGGVPLAKGTETRSRAARSASTRSATEVSPSRRGLKHSSRGYPDRKSV